MPTQNLISISSSSTYVFAMPIALTAMSTGTGPLVVTATVSPSRTRPAMAPASLYGSVFSLEERSSSEGMLRMGFCFLSTKQTRDDWRMSSSKVGVIAMSHVASSLSRYLRAMAMAFIAWLMAAGPVATTEGGWPLEDSRTTWQMAPAIEFGFESPLTLSRGLSEAATSP